MTPNSRRPAGSMGTACRVRPKLRAAAVEPVQGAQRFSCRKDRQKRDQHGRAEQRDEPGFQPACIAWHPLRFENNPAPIQPLNPKLERSGNWKIVFLGPQRSERHPLDKIGRIKLHIDAKRISARPNQASNGRSSGISLQIAFYGRPYPFKEGPGEFGQFWIGLIPHRLPANMYMIFRSEPGGKSVPCFHIRLKDG